MDNRLFLGAVAEGPNKTKRSITNTHKNTKRFNETSTTKMSVK